MITSVRYRISGVQFRTWDRPFYNNDYIVTFDHNAITTLYEQADFFY
jgi:hypothetical protein